MELEISRYVLQIENGNMQNGDKRLKWDKPIFLMYYFSIKKATVGGQAPCCTLKD